MNKTSKNDRYFPNYSNGTGTANIKMCPLTNGPVVMNHGRRKKKMGEKAAIKPHKNIRM